MRRTTGRWMILAATWAGLAGLATAQPVYPVTETMKQLLARTESFGLKRFPISMWNYTSMGKHGSHMTEEQMQWLAEAGITVPQGPEFDPDDPAQKAQMLRMLDWAQKRGMKLILNDPRARGRIEPGGNPPADYAAGVEKAVADFGKHPATFGFHIGDEPAEEGMQAFSACQRIQKRIAPHLQSFLNHLPMGPGGDAKDGFLDRYLRLSGSDLLAYDRYTQMNVIDVPQGINTYYESIRIYREVSLRHGVPFWNTLLSTGHYLYRCPNLDEFRWQFNTSLAFGANGIVWFFWYQPELFENYRLAPVDEFWERTQTYFDIRRVQTAFHKTYGDLFNRLVSTRVSFFPAAMGGGQSFTPSDLVRDIWPAYDNAHPVLVGEFADAQGRRYVMIVNNSQSRSERVLIKFPQGAKLYTFAHGSEGRETLANDGTKPNNGFVEAWAWLSPGQEALFRVELPR